ncbi:MAG: hypothetical protein AAFO80_12460 [Pseudomonadota bacterium]
MAPPWHFWPMTLFTLAWTAIAAADYLMTQYAYAPYIALFTEDQVAYFTTLPASFDAPWAIGAFAGVLGAVMLAGRLSGAPVLLAIAAVAMVYAALWLVVLSDPPMRAVAGLAGDVIVSAGAVVSVLVWLYARVQHQRGVF